MCGWRVRWQPGDLFLRRSPAAAANPAAAAALAQVLDEADQLLEMGFRPAIEKILSELALSWR